MAATPQPALIVSPNDPDAWSQSDAVKLRNYILEHPKFMRVLAKRRPKIEGSTMEARAVTGSDVNGFLACMDTIEALQRDPDILSEDAGFIS